MIIAEKVYEYDLTGQVSFGDLGEMETYEILKDGRLASHFLERQLCVWFPELTFVDGRGHDHIDEEGNLYDQKCFTKGGAGFAPSHMGGKGRVFVKEEAHRHCSTIIYIICDIIDFPKVRVKFLHGTTLLGLYPKLRIPNKDRELIFYKEKP